MSDTVFSARGLRFAYGEDAVLQGIDLEVRAGEIVGLVGADGAGKTTLLRIAAGQLEPEAGEAAVLGRTPSDPALRDHIAYMPQGFGLYHDLSVAENLSFFADLHGLPRRDAERTIADLLVRTGLAGFEVRRAGQLSGGMMQKLALSCALVSAPRVMFLDEPTTGVDPVSRRAFWRLLEGVRTEGVAILYATANMEEAERCDRVALLQAGRVTRRGTPLALADPGAMQLVSVVAGRAARDLRAAVRALTGVRLVFAVGPRLHVWLDEGTSPAAFQRAAAALGDVSIEPMRPSLHDTALRDLALQEDVHERPAA